MSSRLPSLGLTCTLLFQSVLAASWAHAQIDFQAVRIEDVGPGSGGLVAFGDFNEDGRDDLAVYNQTHRVEIFLHDGLDRFIPHTTILLGHIPLSILAGDFNDDGHLDLVVGRSSPNRVNFYPGDGAGNFGMPLSILAGLPPDLMRAHDLNGDGQLDLVALRTWFSDQNDWVSVLLGDGTGVLGPYELFYAPQPDDVTFGDFDEDGDTDLAVAADSIHQISLLFGDGSGAFETDGVPVSYNPETVAVGDFNEDGIDDLAVAQNHTIPILLGDGAGGFILHSEIAQSYRTDFVITEDFNNDGHLDLAAYDDFFGDLVVLLGDGSGSFGTEWVHPQTIWYPLWMISGDFNENGNVDLAITEGEFDRIWVLSGFGDGTFSGPIQHDAGDYPGQILATDIDGDSHLDIVVSLYEGISALLGNGSGGFGPPIVTPVEHSRRMATGDFNQDSIPDLATNGDESTRVLLGDGTGAFLPGPPIPVDHDSSFVHVDDFNGDSVSDVALAHTFGFEGRDVSILLGNGSGGLGSSVTYATGDRPLFLVSMDFDRNGTRDLVSANWSGSSLTQLFGDGAGEFLGRFVRAGRGPIALVTQDFDGDGHLDLAAADRTGDSVSVYGGSGDGQFGPATVTPVGDRPESIVAADWNGDGYVDVATGNTYSRDVTVLDGDAAGGFSTSRTYDAKTDPESIHAADLTSDGRTDLAVWNGAWMVVVPTDDAGGFDEAHRFPVSTETEDLTKADLNEDGFLDLLVASQSGNRIAMFLGNGSGGFGPETPFTATRPQHLVVGDFNEDGHDDVVTAGHDNAFLQVLLGDGLGGLGTPSQVALSGAAVSIKRGDFNEDGHFDIAAAILSARVVDVVLGRGDGTFLPQATIGGFYDPVFVTAGDFDALDDPHGHLDLLVVDPGRAGATVVKGDGNGGFVVANSFPILPGGAGAAISDFNEDGHLDVAVTYASGSVLSVRLGTGHGTFPPRPDVGLPTTARTAKARDFNLDGHVDLAVARSWNKGWVFLLGTGDGEFLPGRLFGPPGASTGMVTADFDEDGTLDVALAMGNDVAVCRNRTLDLTRCRAGNVNDRALPRADVLTVNDEPGDLRREMTVDAGAALRVTLDKAPTPALGAKYYAAVWLGPPDETTTALLPADLGFGCFQPIRTRPEYIEPLHVANTIKPNDSRIDPPGETATGVPGSALPAVVLDVPPGTFAPGTVLTIQGIVGDGNSLARKPASLTNAVVVTVE